MLLGVNVVLDAVAPVLVNPTYATVLPANVLTASLKFAAVVVADAPTV